MAKLFFLPFSVATGLLSGLISKKTFEMLWGKIDGQAPPMPKDREANAGKLALALVLEGALLRVVKGLLDHGSRQGFAKLTGTWPGNRKAQTD